MVKKLKEKTESAGRFRRFYLFGFIILLIAAGLGYWHTLKPKRVYRKHSDAVSKEFEYLTRRINFSFPGNNRLSKKEAEQDLDELEWLLDNRYSYLKLKGIDYRAALDRIRSSVGNGISRGTLALQLMKFMALFGDGHSGVSDPSLKQMCNGFLPFLVAEVGGRVPAFKADHSDFVDAQHPFLRSIDGIDIKVWLDAAGQTAAKGSPQFVHHRCIRNLRYIQYLRKELGLEISNMVEIELETMDSQSSKTLSVAVAEEFLEYGPWPRTQSRILDYNIGYLRIPLWMSNEQEFLDELVAYMKEFRNTRGLIIDIRGIGGGSRVPLRTLFPFFMADSGPPKVINIAAYRLGHRKDILDARWLYPASSPRWTADERTSIEQASQQFNPKWRLPSNEFSKWHYFVLKANRENGTYYYHHPDEYYEFQRFRYFSRRFQGLEKRNSNRYAKQRRQRTVSEVQTA